VRKVGLDLPSPDWDSEGPPRGVQSNLGKLARDVDRARDHNENNDTLQRLEVISLLVGAKGVANRIMLNGICTTRMCVTIM
jgi:hypothetical protein